MKVAVIEALPKTALVEFSDADGLLQRRVIPQELYAIHRKGPTTIPDKIVYLGLEYSNVDLAQTLGEALPVIRVRDLEQALRAAGLWTQKDYAENPSVVAGVWQKLRGIDVSAILNAAHRL